MKQRTKASAKPARKDAKPKAAPAKPTKAKPVAKGKSAGKTANAPKFGSPEWRKKYLKPKAKPTAA